MKTSVHQRRFAQEYRWQHIPPPGSLFVDHVAHFVPGLGAAARALEALGFTVTPVSAQRTQDGPAGTSNVCVMLEDGYLEILAPDGAQVQAIRMYAQDSPDRSCGDEVSKAQEGRMILQDVPDHQPPIEAPRQIDQLFGLLDIEGERLLDQNVLACLERELGETVMGGGLGRDDDALDRGVISNAVEG